MKPVEDPSKFKDVTMNIKKKRTQSEAFGGNLPDSNDAKRRKLNDEEAQNGKSNN